MKEVFNVDGDLFSKMVTVDVLVGNALLALLLIGVGRAVSIDKFLNANSDSVEKVKKKIEKYNMSIARIPNLTELIYILSIGFGVTGLCHLIADSLAPFILTNFPNLQKYSLTSTFFLVNCHFNHFWSYSFVFKNKKVRRCWCIKNW